MQRIAIEKSRLGIPILFSFDVIHGYKTIFPTPLALSSSWDTELVKQSARIAAREAFVSGINLTFSPMVDVSRDARWGRISESSGEDVLLTMRFGRAMVEGYQGTQLNAKYSIGACVKHFVGYGAAIGGRDYQFTELSERALRETYLPPFHECLKAGAVSVMSAFNDISGVPASANPFTLKQILRDEWNFKGFVVSDWQSVAELIKHGIADSEKNAALAGIKAGVDMEMTSNCYATLIEEVKSNRLPIKVIDDAVKHVLRIKFELGLFENPYTLEEEEIKEQLTEEHRSFARKAAAECMVLLKNNNILPLKNPFGRYTVLGEWANNKDLIGWWTGNADKCDVVTVIEGLKSNKPSGVRISQTADLQSNNSDTVIVCIGESGNMFGENHSRSELDLPWGQTEQIRQLKENGKTIIVIIFNGRPLVLTEIQKYADAIIMAWHPGVEAGNALADILFGKVNPSGHLTVSLPKKSGQVPLFYCDRNSGRPEYNHYIDVDAQPLFPFGYGLSYTSFSYKNMVLSKNQISKNDRVKVSVEVSNTGKYTGKEVVQLYIHDKVASITQPQKKLIDFLKIELKPGEMKTVSFEISPGQLSIFDKDLHSVIESGDFDVWIGQDSNDIKQHKVLTIK
jgi:beta-glucosidase